MAPMMVSQSHKVELWLRPWFPKEKGETTWFDRYSPKEGSEFGTA